jgi:hypothetical protein
VNFSPFSDEEREANERCPACGAYTTNIKCKLVCTNPDCRMIVRSCCE